MLSCEIKHWNYFRIILFHMQPWHNKQRTTFSLRDIFFQNSSLLMGSVIETDRQDHWYCNRLVVMWLTDTDRCLFTGDWSSIIGRVIKVYLSRAVRPVIGPCITSRQHRLGWQVYWIGTICNCWHWAAPSQAQEREVSASSTDPYRYSIYIYITSLCHRAV